jgi:hypothetical protein
MDKRADADRTTDRLRLSMLIGLLNCQSGCLERELTDEQASAMCLVSQSITDVLKGADGQAAG